MRRDLLLDQQHVVLERGFEGADALFAWNDGKLNNLDRDAVAIPVGRVSLLTWNVGARGGQLRVGAARLHVGSSADASACQLVITPQGTGAGPVTLELPPVSADDGAPAGAWREGPSADLSIVLARGTTAVQFEVRSPDGAPQGAAVALLSPRVEQPPLEVRADECRVAVPVAEWLLSHAPTGEQAAPTVVFAQRAPANSAAPGTPEDVRAAPVEALAAFTGEDGLHHADGRPALVFTGESALDVTLDIPAHSALVGAVALDRRMPAGAAAGLQVLVDGAVVGSERVDSAHWRDVRVDLAAQAGPGRRLTLRLVEPTLAPRAVTVTDVDLQAGVEVRMDYTASRVRLGFGNARVQHLTDVVPRPSSPQRPSMVLVQVETLRADVLPFLGGELPELAPNLAAFAQDSVVWEHAMTPSSWTLPSTVSLLTGLLPSAHGAVDHDRLVVPGDVLTLAERAARAGVATGAVLASDILRPQAGFDRGFLSCAHVPYANMRQVDALAESFLENHAGQQFLLFVHAFDPHSPYNAPGAWRDRFCEPALRGQDVHAAELRLLDVMNKLQHGESAAPDPADMRLLRERYRGEIAWFDEQFGRLLATLDRLGLADTTLVVLTADHGEEFMEHGLIGHGSHLFDESLHVPLLVRGLPGKGGGPQKLLGGTRLPGVVSTASVCASVLQWLDVGFDAGALWPALERSGPCVFSETDKGVALGGGGDPLRRHLARVRTDTHGLVWSQSVEGEEGPGTWALYDLRADPGELAPIDAGASPGPELKQCLDSMWDWCRARSVVRLLPSGGEDLFEKLQQIGYIK